MSRELKFRIWDDHSKTMDYDPIRTIPRDAYATLEDQPEAKIVVSLNRWLGNPGCEENYKNQVVESSETSTRIQNYLTKTMKFDSIEVGLKARNYNN